MPRSGQSKIQPLQSNAFSLCYLCVFWGNYSGIRKVSTRRGHLFYVGMTYRTPHSISQFAPFIKISQHNLGRSRGGFTTKIHGLCDALGNPLGFILTGGQAADCTQAIALLENKAYEALLADKGYDSNVIVEHVEANGASAVIPPKKNRINHREYDKDVYKERHKIECLFGFLKHYRRLFSQFENLDLRFYRKNVANRTDFSFNFFKNYLQ